jgi:hypothetical protein
METNQQIQQANSSSKGVTQKSKATTRIELPHRGFTFTYFYGFIIFIFYYLKTKYRDKHVYRSVITIFVIQFNLRIYG